MRFSLQERPAPWIATAPVRVERELLLTGEPDRVFAVLADFPRWPEWFGGMSKVVVEDPAEGVGATRVVKVGLTEVRERFVVWEPPHRLALIMTASNTPGLRAMGEDWRLEPAGPGRTRLRFVAGFEPHPMLRPLAPVLRAIVAKQVGGAAGLAEYLVRG